jgi:hypothetical protein
MRANFVMSFQKTGGVGYRTVPRVCSYCGSGNFDRDAGEAGDGTWQCRVCGRTTAPKAVTLGQLDGLDAEARGLFQRGAGVRLLRAARGLRWGRRR